MRIILSFLSFILISTPVYAKGNLLSYSGFADAKFEVNEHNFSVYVHPKENLLLIQPQLKDTNKSVNEKWNIDTYREAAEFFVAPVGCGIPSVQAITKIGASWEAEYMCPDDVDLRKLINEQKKDLKKGIPIHK